MLGARAHFGKEFLGLEQALGRGQGNNDENWVRRAYRRDCRGQADTIMTMLVPSLIARRRGPAGCHHPWTPFNGAVGIGRELARESGYSTGVGTGRSGSWQRWSNVSLVPGTLGYRFCWYRSRFSWQVGSLLLGMPVDAIRAWWRRCGKPMIRRIRYIMLNNINQRPAPRMCVGSSFRWYFSTPVELYKSSRFGRIYPSDAAPRRYRYFRWHSLALAGFCGNFSGHTPQRCEGCQHRVLTDGTPLRQKHDSHPVLSAVLSAVLRR